MKKRLIEFLSYLSIGQKKFEQNCGLSNGYVDKLGDNITLRSLNKISFAYPELNTMWLQTGEGEMLKPKHVTQNMSGNINVSGGNSAFVGQMHGGTFNQDAGKDQVIEKQEKEVSQMFSTFTSELNDFHAINKRRDEYMEKQDAYIASIIKHSYLRNRENMERIDKLAEQQTELIQMVAEQNRRMQDRADRLLDILEKKI